MILHSGLTGSYLEPSLSSAMIIQDHPFLVLEKVITRCGADLTFTCSRYEIARPGHQAAAPRTPPLRIHSHNATCDWLNERLAELGPAEEMALHSLVEYKGSMFHIPMIDFLDHPSTSFLCEMNNVL